MSRTDRDTTRVVRSWLDQGADRIPDRVLDAVEARLQATPQRRAGWLARRFPIMNSTTIRYGIAATVVVIVALAGFQYLSPNVGGPEASPTGSLELPASPTPASSTPTPPASASLLDTTSWTAYESERYGWTIGHPADWTVTPAEHDWTLARDADDVLSAGQEMFTSPSGNVRVSAWSVPFTADEGSGVETAAPIRAWIEQYCEQASGASCSSYLEQAVPLCLERRDCHPGLLVPFQYEVQAFFAQGIYEDQLVVVTVWWGEDEPAVAPYGGSQRLLEAFLSTMAVWPESVPFEERQCFDTDSDEPLC